MSKTGSQGAETGGKKLKNAPSQSKKQNFGA